jgi:hypothetical protein
MPRKNRKPAPRQLDEHEVQESLGQDDDGGEKGLG